MILIFTASIFTFGCNGRDSIAQVLDLQVKIFDQPTIGGNEVRYHTEEEDDYCCNRQDAGCDNGLHMATAPANGHEVEIP